MLEPILPTTAGRPSIDVRTTDRERLPPGQIITQKWPVLHYGDVPTVHAGAWHLNVTGLVANPRAFSWDELHELGLQDTVCDMHCVTRWSRYDNVFTGVPVLPLIGVVQPLPNATHVLIHAEENYTTNLPIEDFALEANLFATHFGGEELTPEHGGPIRLLVPHLYLWKSAKWVTGVEFMDGDEPGFWEENGYHMRGEPWLEQRFGRPDYTKMRRGPRR